jgi:hypothetical protein
MKLKKIKILFVFCLYLIQMGLHAQYDIVHTNTTSSLIELNNYNGEVFIVGNKHFLAKYNLELDFLEEITAPGPSLNYIHSFNRLDSNLVFLVSSYPSLGEGSYYIFESSDNCETWNLVFDTTNLRIKELIMFDAYEGIFISSYYSVFRSLDGFNTIEYEMSPQMYTSALEKYNDSILCFGELGDMTISFDRGRTWSPRSYIMELPNSFDFISLDSIVSSANGYFAKSIDGGYTWQQKYIGYNSPKILHDPNNSNTLFIIGAMSVQDELGTYLTRGMIMKSNDFGETWHTYNTGLPTRFLNMEFISDSVALICGTDGYLIKYFYRDHHLGFEELNDQLSDIKLYPNPTSQLQQIEIKTINSEDIEVSLLDVFGKEIKTVNEQDFHNGVYTASFDLSMLSSGFYVYKIRIGETVTYLKSQKM